MSTTDLATAALVQLIRAGVSSMARAPLVATGAPFILALFEGAILADSITNRKRLTITGTVILMLRVLFDALISRNSLNAILGVVGTGAGLLLGPMFDTTPEPSRPPPSSTHSSHSTLLPHTPKIKLKLPSLSSPGTRSSATVRPTQHFTPTSATSSYVHIPSEPSSAVSAASGTLPPIQVELAHSEVSGSTTRGFHHHEGSEPNHWIVDATTPTIGSTPSVITLSGVSGAHFERPPSPSPSLYPAHRESSLLNNPTAKERSKLLRAVALAEDYKRRNALTQRQKMVEEGDFAWAFYLKHRAEIAKGKMEEADREAAREIYDCELKYT